MAMPSSLLLFLLACTLLSSAIPSSSAAYARRRRLEEGSDGSDIIEPEACPCPPLVTIKILPPGNPNFPAVPDSDPLKFRLRDIARTCRVAPGELAEANGVLTLDAGSKLFSLGDTLNIPASC